MESVEHKLCLEKQKQRRKVISAEGIFFYGPVKKQHRKL